MVAENKTKLSIDLMQLQNVNRHLRQKSHLINNA